MRNESRNADGTYAENTIAAVYDALTREMKRLSELRAADQLAVAAALNAAKEAVAAALISAKEAVQKAEESQLRTNQQQNEFRQQLKDQAATFLPREEYRIQHLALEDRVDKNSQDLNDLRVLVTQGPASLPRIQAAIDESSGRRTGAIDTRTVIFGVIGLVWPIIAFLLLNGGKF